MASSESFELLLKRNYCDLHVQILDFGVSPEALGVEVPNLEALETNIRELNSFVNSHMQVSSLAVRCRFTLLRILYSSLTAQVMRIE